MRMIVRCVFLQCLFLLSFFMSGSALSAVKVLVINPDIAVINEVAKNLEKSLKSQKIDAKQKSVSQEISESKFRDLLDEHKPGLLIVFDNKLLGYAIKVSESKEFKNIPVISVMSLNLKQTIASNKNATGIAYEIPPFLLIDSFNRFLKKRIDKVAVIYREGLFDWYIKEAKKQLEYSKVTLIEQAVPKDVSANDVEKLITSAFDRFKKEKADAFWLITDNAIINQKSMKNLKSLTNKLRMPFLCGVKNLVTKEFDLCSFSSLPDDEVVVEQSLEQTLAIVEDKLAPHDLKVEYLERVVKILNLEKLESYGYAVDKVKLEDIELAE